MFKVKLSRVNQRHASEFRPFVVFTNRHPWVVAPKGSNRSKFRLHLCICSRSRRDAVPGNAFEPVRDFYKVKNGGETRPRFPAVYSSTHEKKSSPIRLQSHTTTNFATTRSVERGPPTLVDPRRYEMNRPILPVSRLGTDVCLRKRDHDGKK